MNRLLIAFSLGLAIVAMVHAALASHAMPRQVLAGDHRLRMQVCGHGAPAVVFDTFGPANLEIWSQIQREVSHLTTTVTYDHAGYWGSEDGPKPRDARRLAEELHRLLKNAALDPPFILVGYSMGGPYARVFASQYPHDVVGLVLVDPTQESFIEWFTAAYPDWNRIPSKHLEAQDEWGSVTASLAQASAAQLPDVPVTLITGMKSYDLLTHAVLPRWLESHRDWLRHYPNARHIVTTNSAHNVVLKEPELVIGALRDLLRNRLVQ